ncbi:hypothetical protein Tco_0701119 [Tanacetum coccineum]
MAVILLPAYYGLACHVKNDGVVVASLGTSRGSSKKPSLDYLHQQDSCILWKTRRGDVPMIWREFESIGNEGKCALEIEIRLIFHQSIEIDQVGQRFEIVEILTEMVVEVVDSSFLEVILPRSSDMDEVQWVNLDMSMTLVLAIFLGGFLVDDEALEAIIEKI